MKRTVQVVMLPTNEKAKVGMINLEPFNREGHKLELIRYVTNGDGLNPQHLYFLSDEEIKEGDWVYRDTGTIFQMTKELSEYYKSISNTDVHKKYKIIVTTDTFLRLTEIVKEDGSTEFPYITSLPQPSQSFIEHFVKEYNKGNVITEVEVEYEEGKYNLDELRERHLKGLPHSYDYCKLKINPDNTINILTKKDSWSREEVMEIARRYAKRCQAPMTDTKWLGENLDKI